MIFWTRFDKLLDHFWWNSGPFLDGFLTTFGPDLDNFWTNFGQILAQFWIDFGPFLDQIWSIFGPKFDRFWIKSWSILGNFWAEAGSLLILAGPILGSFQPGSPPHIEGPTALAIHTTDRAPWGRFSVHQAGCAELTNLRLPKSSKKIASKKKTLKKNSCGGTLGQSWNLGACVPYFQKQMENCVALELKTLN